MMKLTTVLLFAPLLVAVAVAVHAADPAANPTDIDRLNSAIEAARREWDVPGLAVAIVKDGETVLAQGYGVREIDRSEPVDAETLFAIASNTKAFTAAALAILEDEGKIGWNDRVQQHLPWLHLYDPCVSSDLRVDDLLCHRTGLKTFSGDLLWWGTAYSPEDVLRRVRHLQPTAPFRAQYGYSNLPEERLGIVVLTNSLAPLAVPIANHIRDEYLGGDRKDWFSEGLQQYRKHMAEFDERIQKAIAPAAEGTQPSRPLDAYTGTFTCPMYGDATVTKEGEQLVLRLLPNEQLVADLTHQHYDTWIIRWRSTFAWFAEGTAQFVPDARGDFRQLKLEVPNDDLWFDELELRWSSDG